MIAPIPNPVTDSKPVKMITVSSIPVAVATPCALQTAAQWGLKAGSIARPAASATTAANCGLTRRARNGRRMRRRQLVAGARRSTRRPQARADGPDARLPPKCTTVSGVMEIGTVLLRRSTDRLEGRFLCRGPRHLGHRAVSRLGTYRGPQFPIPVERPITGSVCTSRKEHGRFALYAWLIINRRCCAAVQGHEPLSPAASVRSARIVKVEMGEIREPQTCSDK
jgi:hypothetical protein